MLRALIEGKASPQEMAELAKGRMRAKIPELEPTLEGKLEDDHRFLLRLQLQRLEAAEKDLAFLRIQEKLKPYEAQLTLLDEIPDVDWKTAAGIGYKRAVVAVAHKILSGHLSHAFPPSLLERIGRSLLGQAQQAQLD